MVGTSHNTVILQREHFVWRLSLWFTKGEPRVLEKGIYARTCSCGLQCKENDLQVVFQLLGWPREDSWKGSKDKFSLI